MGRSRPASDAELLKQSDVDAEAFAAFYRRHLALVLGFVMRRVESREVAADLTAEVFAAALQARHRFDPDRGTAPAWLCTIASRKIIDSVRKGQVEDRARRELQLQPVELTDRDLARLEFVASDDAALGEVAALVEALGPEESYAVRERIIEERAYVDIAREIGCSESVVRKRVSRGLKRLRRQLEEAR